MALIAKFVTVDAWTPPVRDVGDPKGSDNCHQRHENRTGSPGIDGVREKDTNDVANHDADRGGHRAWVNPVIEVGTPTEDEFGHSRESKVLRMVEERLFGEQVGASGAGVKFVQLRVGDRGREGEGLGG
jgi:hypothetical protein